MTDEAHSKIAHLFNRNRLSIGHPLAVYGKRRFGDKRHKKRTFWIGGCLIVMPFHHAIENLDAAYVELCQEEFDSLEEALDQCTVYGHRGLGGF